MLRAVEVIEEHKVEQLRYFDLVSVQTSPCSVHVEQDITRFPLMLRLQAHRYRIKYKMLNPEIIVIATLQVSHRLCF
jgi:hypothetical protein